ncbi:DinB family protein [Peribacillus deserti]|uniref:DinB family protein n=1 Tax=Peribacillus deserti TaxID=673318 RepID=A0A2N5M811_9BACI|nr:DinB family protein [Peribacillus deserti]PLT30487.1 DinB family protein [Peribacillus deserti]
MYKLPETNEYPPYYSTYIKLVPEGDLVDLLTQQQIGMNNDYRKLTEKQAVFRYAPEKWSIKEVIGHITDTERIMGFRLLSFARGEDQALPGYDENKYVMEASFNESSLDGLLKSYSAVRLSTLHLLKSLHPSDWDKKGNANNSVISVRALAAIIAGHELHHRKIIRDRYFGSDSFTS